jgi:hypothetical protein
MTVGVIAKLGSGPMAIYMNRREDSGGWATGQQHSPVTIKNGFPGAGGPIMGEYTRAQLIAAGGGCLFGIQVDGREWTINQTITPYNLPYDAQTNPYGYSNLP